LVAAFNYEAIMDAGEFKRRTRGFALRIVQLIDMLPGGRACDVLGRQLLRSGTSVGANYRAACRARSQAEFIAKMGVVEEEADECIYWLELIQAKGMPSTLGIPQLIDEANQILSMVVASIKTARRNR
jgi:four helix bundle protein